MSRKECLLKKSDDYYWCLFYKSLMLTLVILCSLSKNRENESHPEQRGPFSLCFEFGWLISNLAPDQTLSSRKCYFILSDELLLHTATYMSCVRLKYLFTKLSQVCCFCCRCWCCWLSFKPELWQLSIQTSHFLLQELQAIKPVYQQGKLITLDER